MMNYQTFRSVLKIIENTYINRFLINEEQAQTWYEQLKEYDPKVFMEAVEQYTKNEKWEPVSPRALIDYIEKQTPGELTTEQAYILVLKAIKKYGTYKQKEAREFLQGKSPMIWEAISTRPNGWNSACTTKEESYERFFKATYNILYRGRKDKQYRDSLTGNKTNTPNTKAIETVEKRTATDDEYKEYREKFDELKCNVKEYQKPKPRKENPTQEEVKAVLRVYSNYFPGYKDFTAKDFQSVSDTLKAGYTVQEFERVANYKANKTNNVIESYGIAKGCTPVDLYGVDADGYWIYTWLNQEIIFTGSNGGGVNGTS